MDSRRTNLCTLAAASLLMSSVACEAERLSFNSGGRNGGAAGTTASEPNSAGAAPNAGGGGLAEPPASAGSTGAIGGTGGNASPPYQAGGGSGGAREPQYFRVEAFIVENIEACATGEPCSGDNCIGFYDANEERKHAFSPDTLQVVKPSDPLTTTAEKVHCFRAALSSTETEDLRRNLETVRNQVAEWTQGLIRLDLVFHQLSVEGHLSRHEGGLWMSPLDVINSGFAARTERPDFVIVSHGLNDPDTLLHFAPAACGLAYGADNGIAGAGYAWKPKTGGPYPEECSSPGGYAYEWLLQVHYGLTQLSGFEHLNVSEYPACRAETRAPATWFPGAGDCLRDPDHVACGQESCADLMLWTEHVFRTHYDPNRKLVLSHCKNGKEDFDETAVDLGGRCSP